MQAQLVCYMRDKQIEGQVKEKGKARKEGVEKGVGGTRDEKRDAREEIVWDSRGIER